ncbi:MAG: M14 family zinc carboxypeptidase, partial [Candidatus Thermoplasmatota archaeon]|nr:M14 family zinc carboxypeptidase [Candidatus Thermoplasmatota archaeon]
FSGLAAAMFIAVSLAGCTGVNEGILGTSPQSDDAAILPHFEDFHGYDAMAADLKALNEKYPNLTEVYSIGKSAGGHEIWMITITNENSNASKFESLWDGGRHGDELQGIEAPLYLAHYLLENYDGNATVRKYLDSQVIHIMPVANPDGHIANARTNANSVNLNRNFDVDWGDYGGVYFDEDGNPQVGFNVQQTFLPVDGLEYTGPYPNSEPENQAFCNFTFQHKLSFYMSYHTALHALLIPWECYRPPFHKPAKEQAVYDYIRDWTLKSTEYEAGEGAEAAGYSHGGASFDWVYMTFRIPSFELEVYNSTGGGDIDFWCQTALGQQLFFLENMEKLSKWEIPALSAPTPQGVPPRTK